MGNGLSPKRLQKSGELEEALTKFKKRYYDAVEEGDRFLSGLYLDEIVQTILLQKKERIQELNLRDLLRDVTKEVPSGKEEEVLRDIEIAVRKRFPEKFGVGSDDKHPQEHLE